MRVLPLISLQLVIAGLADGDALFTRYFRVFGPFASTSARLDLMRDYSLRSRSTSVRIAEATVVRRTAAVAAALEARNLAIASSHDTATVNARTLAWTTAAERLRAATTEVRTTTDARKSTPTTAFSFFRLLNPPLSCQ